MFLRRSSSALALSLLLAPAAQALTPQEVWDGWVKYYQSTGYTVTEGSRDLAGETLTVKDVVLSFKNDDSDLRMTLPQVVMQAAGDGGVRTTMSDSFGGQFQATNEGDKPVIVDFTIDAPGAEVVSTGDLEKRLDRTTMPKMTFTITKVDLPDDQPDVVNPLTLTLTDSVNEMTTEAGKGYEGTGKIAKLDYAIDVDHEGNVFKGNGSIEGIDGSGSFLLPAGGAFDTENIAKSLNDGASMEATLKLGAGSSSFDYAATGEFPKADGGDDADADADADADGEAAAGMPPAQPSHGSMKSTTASGEISFRLAKDGIGYKGAATGIDASITDSELPAPITYKAENAGFDVLFPISKSDTPSPFKLIYSMKNVTLGDNVWALFDPSAKLPRAPMNLDLDLAGLIKVKKDLFDPATLAGARKDTTEAMDHVDDATDAPKDGMADEAAPATGDATAADDGAMTDEMADDSADADDEMPFEPVELTINKIALDAVGAKLEANGTLKPSGEGPGAEPVGSINAKIEGLNGLIDTLTAMGLVPQEQVQGFRMMLALFTKPGEGADTLTSEIEFKEDGSVLANGQQIK